MNAMEMLRRDGLKLGFTGTHLGMVQPQKVKLDHLFAGARWKQFHHGDCVGADAEGHDLMRKLRPSAKIIGHPPDNPKNRAFKRCDILLPEKPYLERNHDIVHDCDLLIGCPASMRHVMRSGTWATLRYANELHRPFVIVLPNGLLRVDLPALSE